MANSKAGDKFKVIPGLNRWAQVNSCGASVPRMLLAVCNTPSALDTGKTSVSGQGGCRSPAEGKALSLEQSHAPCCPCWEAGMTSPTYLAPRYGPKLSAPADVQHPEL